MEVELKCKSCGVEAQDSEVTVGYTAPLIFWWMCRFCGQDCMARGRPIPVLTGEEAMKKRPEMYGLVPCTKGGDFCVCDSESCQSGNGSAC
jgi:hypothetical protein